MAASSSDWDIFRDDVSAGLSRAVEDPVVDDDPAAATAAAIAASVNADAPGVSAADAAAIQRAMYEAQEGEEEEEEEEKQCVPLVTEELRVPVAKHALFSVANSSNYFELNRKAVGFKNLLDDVSKKEVKLAMTEEHHSNLDGRIRSSNFVFSVLGNCRRHSPVYQDCAARWRSFMASPDALQALRWDVLAICLESNDPVGIQNMWGALRADCPDETGPKMPDSVRHQLFSRAARREETLMQMLKCIICTCRKPHLGLLMLESLHREAVCRQSFSYTWRRDLAAIAVAIADTVFGSDKAHKFTYEHVHEMWMSVFVVNAPKSTAECHCVPDKATDLDAWKRLIYALFDIVGDAIPERIMETLTDTRKHTLGMLQIAVRLSDHDTFFLEELLKRKHWSGPNLSEAYGEALHSYHGIRGPNVSAVLGLLYTKQLMEWRSNDMRRVKGIVTSVDELAKSWTTIILSARGYAEIDVDGHNTICMPSAATKNGQKYPVDPAVCMEVVYAMIKVHDPDPKDNKSADWDRSSRLFASLIKIALRACIGNKEKTHLVELFLNLSIRNGDAAFSTLWHDIPRIVSIVAEDHAELFPLLVKSMLPDARPDVLMYISNIERFHGALATAIFATHKESSRLIVQALRSAWVDLPLTIPNGQTNIHECTLGHWVRKLGAGVSVSERRIHGSDYAAFVNARVEKDLIEVLEGAKWSDTAKTTALLDACTAKRAVVAQVLLRPPYNAKIPSNRQCDPWLQAITQYLYVPGNAGAQAVVSSLETQAQALDNAAPSAASKRDAGEDDLAPPSKAARLSEYAVNATATCVL